MLVSTRTKLPISRWASLMGIHSLHFAQIKLPALSPSGVCDSAWFRHGWQDTDKVSREELAETIARAEAELESYLNYNLVPDWTVDERQQVLRTFVPEFVHFGTANMRSYANAVVTNKKHFIAGGIRTSTLIEAASAITWQAAGAYGWAAVGTSTSAVPAGTAKCEIRAYYPGHNGEDAYEIRPITVSIVGTTLTVTVRRELCVTEALQDDYNALVVDGSDNANFLTTLDVYRVWNDPQTHVSFLWEGGTCEEVFGEYVTQTGVLLARDPVLGVVGFLPATWDSATSAWSTACLSAPRTPDMVRLYYLSGLQDTRAVCPRTDMQADWARTVAIYAASMLERSICNCDASKKVENWRSDLAFSGGTEEEAIYNLTQSQLENPFGTRRGAIYAWQRVKRPNATVATGAVLA